MRRVTASAEIASGPQPVWQLMSEPERYPEYVPATQRLLASSDLPFGVGSTYREYGGIPPFLSESDWEVTAFEPMRYQRHVGDDGKVRMDLDIDLEPTADGGTRLTIGLAVQPRWFMAAPMALLWPVLMRRRAQEVVEGVVANAREIVEEEAVPDRRQVDPADTIDLTERRADA